MPQNEVVDNVVKEINERFGQFQDRECKNLKQQLLALEDPDCPGHVSISKFHGSALNRDKWQFTESIQYLRDIGALREVEQGSPSVLVPNYIMGPSNCVAGSGIFDLCCMDECEGLLKSLEAQLAKAEASPVEIARVVASLPSTSEPVRGMLAFPLLRRLE